MSSEYQSYALNGTINNQGSLCDCWLHHSGLHHGTSNQSPVHPGISLRDIYIALSMTRHFMPQLVLDSSSLLCWSSLSCPPWRSIPGSCFLTSSLARTEPTDWKHLVLIEHYREAICALNATRKEGTDVDLVEGIEWPFLISALWCVLGGAGYIYLGFTSLSMPVYQQQQQQQEAEGEEVSSSKLSRPILSCVCFMLFLFYTCSGAVERVFQSMATTWSSSCKNNEICKDINTIVVREHCYNFPFLQL